MPLNSPLLLVSVLIESIFITCQETAIFTPPGMVPSMLWRCNLFVTLESNPIKKVAIVKFLSFRRRRRRED